jgi:hypothetical protein
VKIRAVAASALALALAAGLTGCNMISPQRTTMEYAASDGINVDLGEVHVRNMLLLANPDGSQANVVFAAVNGTTESAQLNLTINGTAVNLPLTYNPESDITEVGFGEEGEHLVSGSFETGTTVEVEFEATYTAADGTRQTVTDTHRVPILGDEEAQHVLEEYQTLVPQDPADLPAATPEDGTTTEGGE